MLRYLHIRPPWHPGILLVSQLVQGFVVAHHLQCEPSNVVLLKFLVHVRKVDLHGNLGRLKELRPTNVRKLEDMWGLNGAAIE
ncbi:hypothetical protein FIBSPDRAFT_461028 [Athelia psychrophila]|uniref:Uncharacterized protein n=1 Tax=Athelia psychrophila TaxID=1759441 RepID=A0A166LUA6_9AGAM|nr:hypothetical protein FIBSPDRAFT_461028 [Fibularhizoctonia sp. CBS 109695]